ncbi:MAG: SRPBCC domain-containing protein [Halobacteriales archaeon]|nr:SRPBCC domain-containing protein [Halobacteriales archaeon]
MIRHRWFLVLGGLLVLIVAPEARGQSGSSASASDSVFQHRSVVVHVDRQPEKRLAWELVVPASVPEVWNAWTTAEGIATWSAPAGHVELRRGGVWEAYFKPDAPKGQRGSEDNEIVNYVPGRMLFIRAGAPVRFPTVRAEKTSFLLTLTPLGDHHTIIHAVQTGWKEGAEWDEAFEHMAQANAVWLDWLHQRFTTGPIDWSRGPAR